MEQQGSLSGPTVHLRVFLQPQLITHPLAVLLLLTVLGTAIYSNTFSVPFQLDDVYHLVENPRITHLKNFLDLAGTRYISYLSFALNYHFGGLQVFGYHLVNLLIHLTNACLVYGLVRLLWRTPQMAPAEGPPIRAAWVALATALLFVSHPIQTQAVTYILQRLASLATLLYLLAVVCYLQWRVAPPGARSRFLWYGVAILATVLAMKTKETCFTLPLMLVLVEAAFFWPVTRTRWASLVPFLLTLFIIPLSTIDALSGQQPGFLKETDTIARSAYLFTQFRVVVTYIRLLLFPINQHWDYDYPISHSLWEPPVLVSLLVVCSLLGVALALLVHARRSMSHAPFRLVAFGILWFFLTLAMESSIIPIHDVIMEHRLYLPSVGFFLACTTAVLRGRGVLKMNTVTATAILATLLILLCAATYRRNTVWQDALTLWTDVVRKAPNKARGHNNLGTIYAGRGRYDDAITEYLAALSLDPNLFESYFSLGAVYAVQGRWEEATQAYRVAVTLQPRFQTNLVDAHTRLGLLLNRQGRTEEARAALARALAIKPDDQKARQAIEALGR